MRNCPIRVVIADDEPIARRGIRQLLAPYEDIDIVAEARNGKEVVRLLKSLRPDLVFLDVQMPELDGFAALRQLDQSNLPAVIFVTAFDTFAVRAFELHALDYLVKPVHETRFRDALARARAQLNSVQVREPSHRLSMFLGTDNTPPSDHLAPSATARRMVIGTSHGDVMVDVENIAWIEAYDYYAIVHVDGKRHLVRESLASLEKRLITSHFVRAHRSAVVNLAHVHALHANETADPVLILHDGTQIRLSRRRRKEVQSAMRLFAR
jgi:two-component system LytT family response regulator